MTADLVQGFLGDIVAHPDDPSLWLILADWLDDRDDPRAELVRLTWSLQYEPEHPDFAARQARVQALLAGGVVPVRPRRTLGGIDFAWIAPGSFWMGSPPEEADRQENEARHRVTLTRPFWVGVYPVTQAQWQAVVGSTPSYFSRHGEHKEAVEALSDANLERFPVENVSWIDAHVFCVRLAEQVGGRFELPTEAEWEYACRAGTTSPFHFGPILDGTQANCDGHHPYGSETLGPYLVRPTPVGVYPPNAWGLYDFHGNVWEWCEDGQRRRDEKPTSGSATYRVMRGGCWCDTPAGCRAASHERLLIDYRGSGTGFRVVVRLGG